MQKFFVILTLFAALIFVAACGGGSSSGSESSNQKCTPGEFECIGSESYYCNSLSSWVYDARCEDGCNDSTGRCYSDSGNNNDHSNSSDSGNNNDHGDSSDSGSGNDNTDSGDSADSANDNDNTDSSDTSADLTCTVEGSFRCNGDLKQECFSGTWNTLEECDYGCDPVTQKCLGSTECKTGDYECIAGNLSYCNNNFWEIKEKCEYGCDASMRQCLPKDCYTTRIYICGDSNEPGYSQASYYCEDGSWHYDQTCIAGDCDATTGKCKECTSGQYLCYDTYSFSCNNSFWDSGTYCEYDCDSSTGKCRPECSKVGNNMWSPKQFSMKWQDAKDYCDNLTACGYSDWHMPTINELRTLIQNCPETQTGGECGITDSCLSYDECGHNACDGCTSDSGGKSKLGDKSSFWSSSVQSENSNNAWCVDFTDGAVVKLNTSSGVLGSKLSVRCVR